jgi:hypothetical protein
MDEKDIQMLYATYRDQNRAQYWGFDYAMKTVLRLLDEIVRLRREVVQLKTAHVPKVEYKEHPAPLGRDTSGRILNREDPITRHPKS